MENTDQARTGTNQEPAQKPEAAREPGKKEKEFSIAWNLKILAVIYVVLGALYLVLKFTLK